MVRFVADALPGNRQHHERNKSSQWGMIGNAIAYSISPKHNPINYNSRSLGKPGQRLPGGQVIRVNN